VSFVTLLITPEKIDNKIGINTAMLIASVMFHVAVISSLPALGYLTIADRLVMATYITIGFNLFQSVRMLYHIVHNRQEKAKSIYIRSRATVPIACLVIFGIAVASAFI
jgi:hypothetical protein